jgi:hypothetical protein
LLCSIHTDNSFGTFPGFQFIKIWRISQIKKIGNYHTCALAHFTTDISHITTYAVSSHIITTGLYQHSTDNLGLQPYITTYCDLKVPSPCHFAKWSLSRFGLAPSSCWDSWPGFASNVWLLQYESCSVLSDKRAGLSIMSLGLCQGYTRLHVTVSVGKICDSKEERGKNYLLRPERRVGWKQFVTVFTLQRNRGTPCESIHMCLFILKLAPNKATSKTSTRGKVNPGAWDMPFLCWSWPSLSFHHLMLDHPGVPRGLVTQRPRSQLGSAPPSRVFFQSLFLRAIVTPESFPSMLVPWGVTPCAIWFIICQTSSPTPFTTLPFKFHISSLLAELIYHSFHYHELDRSRGLTTHPCTACLSCSPPNTNIKIRA